MHVLISAAAGNDWSYGGAIFTFVFPELLFIFVAGALYVAFTTPHLVPGYRHEPVRPRTATRAATATPGVALPGEGSAAAAGGAGEPAGGPGTDGPGTARQVEGEDS